jgi:hypothetical protein
MLSPPAHHERDLSVLAAAVGAIVAPASAIGASAAASLFVLILIVLIVCPSVDLVC